MTPGVLVALGVHLAAGVVVDATAAAETRATEAGTTVNDAVDAGPALPSGALVLKPGLTAAAARDGLELSLTYAPQLALATGSSSVALLHTADVRAGAPLGPRLAVRGGVGLSVGDLDPSTAQSLFATSSSQANTGASGIPLSYANANANAGASMRLDRRLSLDVATQAATTSSPSTDPQIAALIPETNSAAADASLAWQVARADAVTFGAEARVIAIDGRGNVVGAAPTIGWHHALDQHAYVAVKGGVGLASLDVDGGTKGDAVVPLPAFEARVHTVVDLAGSSALELSAATGVDLSNDPLGSLLEDRLNASLGVGYRATRQVSFHVDTSGFYALYAVGPPPPPATPATALWANRFAVSYAFLEGAALEASAQATTRLVDGFFTTDATVALSVVGTIPIWHAGDRPEGTDPRPGHDVGEVPIGAAPPAGSTTIEEPEPLEDEPDDDATADLGYGVDADGNAYVPLKAPAPGKSATPITPPSKKKAPSADAKDDAPPPPPPPPPPDATTTPATP